MGGVDPSTYDYYGYTINDNGKLKTYPPQASATTRPTSTPASPRTRSARRPSKDKPFFLNIAPNAPHTVSVASNARMEGTPAVAAPRHATRYANDAAPALSELRRGRRLGQAHGARQARSSPYPMPQSDIDSLDRALPRPDGLAAGRRRPGRAGGQGAQAQAASTTTPTSSSPPTTAGCSASTACATPSRRTAGPPASSSSPTRAPRACR